MQFYHDIWEKCSHILAPLTDLLKDSDDITTKGKKKRNKFVWTDVHQEAFSDMKKLIACDITLAYPNFKKPFEIYMDASLQQLGAIIVQDNCPIAFYSHKLNDAQHNYTTTERELLSIVECFKEFRGILLGQHTTVYTDHKDLVYKMSGMTSEWVLRWHLLLQEFAPDICYIKGVCN